MKNSIFGELNLEDNLVIIGPSYIKSEVLKDLWLNITKQKKHIGIMTVANQD
jgi:hypothetical protein